MQEKNKIQFLHSRCTRLHMVSHLDGIKNPNQIQLLEREKNNLTLEEVWLAGKGISSWKRYLMYTWESSLLHATACLNCLGISYSLYIDISILVAFLNICLWQGVFGSQKDEWCMQHQKHMFRPSDTNCPWTISECISKVYTYQTKFCILSSVSLHHVS